MRSRSCVCPRVILFVCLGLACAPALALADWRDFLPRPFENGAYFDTYASFERDNLENGRRPVRWTDTFVKERLTLFSNGYSYHPRFVQYRFSISGAARQEDYETTSQPSIGWKFAEGFEYDAKVLILPEHPYNLELYARRYEPLFKEQAATQHNVVENSRGASFKYRRKPYFMHASYGDDSIESAESTSDVRRFHIDGEYFKRYASGNEFSLNAAYSPSWFSNSLGLDGNENQYLAGNFIKFYRFRLSSTVSKNTFEQHGNAGTSFSNDQIAWYELLTTYLPWNFRTDASYRYQDNQNKVTDTRAEGSRKLSNTSEDLQFDVVHRLYQSVDTNYTLLRSSRTSSTGDTSSLSQSLNVNYTKLIPYGRFLAGLSLASTVTDNNGQADVVDEPHPGITVPGSFTLVQQNVDPTTILVFLKSPLPPFETIRLMENVDYTVIPSLNTFEIHLVNLPPQFAIPGTFDFFVSYSLTTGEFELESDVIGGNVSTQLFDNLLNPYASYVKVTSDVLSGSFPGNTLDSTTYTAGLIVTRGPLRVRGEYQDLQWTVSPYRAWRAEIQYVSGVTPTINVYATAAYVNKYYPHGLSTVQSEALTEETMSGSGSIQKQFFSRNMFVSAGGSYSRLQGLVDSNSYSVNASFIWRIGRVDLTVGASAYATDTTGSGTISNSRDHQLFYLNFRRRLF